jgi:hypothetical protein
MQQIINLVISLIAKSLPSIFTDHRPDIAKLMLIAFATGFLFSYLFNFLVKRSWKAFKKWLKEQKRIRRMASQKIPGTKLIGEVTQYLSKINVAVVKINSGNLKVGEKILIKGKLTEATFVIESMQIDRKAVEIVKKGKEAGIIVPKEVRQTDLVYKLKK